MSTIIKIPVSARVYQFIRNKYGDKCSSLVVFRRNNYLGTLFELSLQKRVFSQTRKKPIDGKFILEFQLPKSMQSCTLTDDNKRLIASHLDKHLTDTFTTYVAAQSKVSGVYLQAIKDFLQTHEIDTEAWDVETARKCFRDYLSKVNKSHED